MTGLPKYSTLALSQKGRVVHVEMCRPKKYNTMNLDFWVECRQCFEFLDTYEECLVIVLSGQGKHFTAGLDMSTLMGGLGADDDCNGRKHEKLYRRIKELQMAFTAIEQCCKPVIAAVHGACIGGGVDMISACDMRYCTDNAYFVVKEVDLAIIADVGTLQRLPKLIGDGVMREISYTGRKVHAEEAVKIGLINNSHADKPALMSHVFAIASDIAGKSPLAIRGIKHQIVYTRDHGVRAGLDYVALWNAGALPSDDIQEAVSASLEKRKPVFSRL